METTHLLDDIQDKDMENAFLTEFSMKWSTYHYNEGTVNYGVPPNVQIEIVLPECNKKITLNLDEVRVSNMNPLSDEIEITIDKYVSFFHVYINPKALFPNDYFECKNIDISIDDYELDEDFLVELFVNEL